MTPQSKILPGTGRGTMRSMVEGARHPLLTHVNSSRVSLGAPSTTPLRVAVPLPVPGRIA
jgi:hypothetical protein